MNLSSLFETDSSRIISALVVVVGIIVLFISIMKKTAHVAVAIVVIVLALSALGIFADSGEYVYLIGDWFMSIINWFINLIRGFLVELFIS